MAFDSIKLNLLGKLWLEGSKININNSGPNRLELNTKESDARHQITIDNSRDLNFSLNGTDRQIKAPTGYKGPTHLEVYKDELEVFHADNIVRPSGKNQHLALEGGKTIALDLRADKYSSETVVSTKDTGNLDIHFTEEAPGSNSYTHGPEILIMNPQNTNVQVNGKSLDLFKGHEDHKGPVKLNFSLGEMRVIHQEKAYIYDQNLRQETEKWQKDNQMTRSPIK